MAARGLRPAAELAANKPCGTRLRYIGGCRCFKCRRANSDYERERQAARAAGDWNGIVDADRARTHLRKLSRAGVGRRSVAAASDVADTVLTEIIAGRKTRIRARTERRILAVTTAAVADHALVSARRAWRRVGELLEEGYTKREIARQLGSQAKDPALQIRKDRVTARTAHKVEVVHRRLTA